MRTKMIGGICSLSLLLSVASCERGVDNESFVSGVTNAQLESPAIDEQSFSILTNSDGTESIKVTWPVVYGAGGYLFSVSCVENPEDESVTPQNPLVVVQDSIVDGCSVAFAKIEDATYNITLSTLGNEQLNNTASAEPTLYTYSALVPAMTIPSGSDIAEFINANLQDSDGEQGFALEAGASYTLNSKVDFGLNQITLRSTEKGDNHPVVTVGAEGTLMTQAGLKIKFIDFDCTHSTQTGLIALSDTPDNSISTESLGYKALGANQNGFVIEKPVMLQACNFKNLSKALLYGNKKNWSLKDFRITDCVVQLDNASSTPVLHLQGASNGLIKSLVIKNSTVYNLQPNGSGYFLRYSNASNSNPEKIFGTGATATVEFANNTFYQTMTGKDFANNVVNNNKCIATFKNNIFYDCFRINKLVQSNWIKEGMAGNILFAVTKNLESNDLKYLEGTEENPNFAGPTDKAFDLSQPKGGVNFKPGSAQAVANQSGDPRWYE